tara:strand:- start:5895 stop:6401 length:507 start_codon:yes stop_codon:yes gene_type:complete
LGIGNSIISGNLPGIRGASLAIFGSDVFSSISASNATLPDPPGLGIQHSNLKNFKKHEDGTVFIINFARSSVRLINFNLFLFCVSFGKNSDGPGTYVGLSILSFKAAAIRCFDDKSFQLTAPGMRGVVGGGDTSVLGGTKDCVIGITTEIIRAQPIATNACILTFIQI